METPRIRITNIDDVCVLVCHLIYSLGCPLSKNQLIEITSLEDAVNYFDLMAALEKSCGHLLDETDIDGASVYSITELGNSTARSLKESIPLSIRDKMFKEAVRVYTRDAMKKGSFLTVRYIRNSDDSCTVGITVNGENSAQQKYYVAVNVKNVEQADKIKKKVKENPKEFERYLDNFFNEQ